jgi:hypothetical protein
MPVPLLEFTPPLVAGELGTVVWAKARPVMLTVTAIPAASVVKDFMSISLRFLERGRCPANEAGQGSFREFGFGRCGRRRAGVCAERGYK